MSGAMVCLSATCVTVYETRVDELRQCLLHVWRGLEQSLIDDAIDQWQTRTCACVRAGGGYFEHTLSLCDYQFVFSVLNELYISHHA